eukprot:CAMPEP_0181254976 /NCGR_PEP_ID=MMETSP1096-20121128/48896_1 /TAXON_ID=156174 ORGANISM="Chrysochromulina ericina, Strain CCMP281" /NCGR_SAMPLE_ID=MMETSP1096 /ASSEMBLY_ACC=CAM_ASM_000453 /LENGTH=77 /DNA_ID=CAMNT_0023353059 /DNA_START=913 /DNA_END=1146 /DNA_ORIENTATION=-
MSPDSRMERLTSTPKTQPSLPHADMDTLTGLYVATATAPACIPCSPGLCWACAARICAIVHASAFAKRKTPTACNSD